MGQELTVRTYHTGATRKRILSIRLLPLDSSARDTPLSQLLPPSPPSTMSLQNASVAGTDITYHPPSSSASKKPRSAGKILALHNSVTSVGLGLVRLEFAERCWWSVDVTSGTIGEWLDSGMGRLSATIGETEYGVYVDKGEAYASSLAEAEAQAKQS